jgi:hypothetical protein
MPRPRSSIGGTSLFAVTFLGLSTGYAYLHPEGIDRLLGGGTGQSSCSISTDFAPCDDPRPADTCDLLMADEEANACLAPVDDAGLDGPAGPSDNALLDCCQGSVSRGALLRASISGATDDPKPLALPALDADAAPSAQDDASAEPPDAPE